jgi:hypothetical protein
MLRRFAALATGAALPFVAAAGTSRAECLTYAGPVALSGRLARVQAFGPPGFGENPKIDAREPYWRLVLRRRACVAGGADPITEAAEPSVGRVQLVWPSKAPASLRSGAPLAVTGRLFHAHTGHHHETLLLTVDSARAFVPGREP